MATSTDCVARTVNRNGRNTLTGGAVRGVARNGREPAPRRIVTALRQGGKRTGRTPSRASAARRRPDATYTTPSPWTTC